MDSIYRRKDHGIIGGAIELSGQNVMNEVDGVVANAVNLRNAAHGVAILHLTAVGMTQRNG